MRAFHLGVTGLVSAVVSLNVVLIIAYAGVFLKERFALKEWIGMIAALVGVVVLSVF
jgi:transporter family protein